MKADSELVRRQNRGLLLATLRRGGPQARIELGRATGLSPATVTAITADLLGEGVLREADAPGGSPAVGKRGRPLVRLALNPAAAHVLAVRIAVDTLELVIADFAGGFSHRRELMIPTFEASGPAFAKRVADAAAAFTRDSGLAAGAIRHCGIAVQGVADTNHGTLVWSPAFRARNIALVEPVRSALGISCSLSNDANMIAEALIEAEPQHYRSTAAVILIGEGIGMGLVIDGRVYHGPTGAAAEFGHMNHRPEGPLCRCGRQGCIEAYAASYGLIRSADAADSGAPPSHTAVPAAALAGLRDRALSGEPAALKAFELSGEALGYGIARLIAILNPERVVFTGTGADHYPLFADALESAIERSLVAPLRRNTAIGTVPLAADAIIRGTAGTALRVLDREVFAVG